MNPIATAGPKGIQADTRISPQAKKTILKEIEEASGSEVLFMSLNIDNKIISDVETLARGNPGQVPVPLPQLDIQTVIIHNHPSGNLQPSDADLAMASQLAQDGIGTWIIDNQVERIYIITEAYEPDEVVDLDWDELSKMFLPGGKLSQSFPSYEIRDAQIDMVELICQAFNQEQPLIVEAGTGVGKSFAYAIPSMNWLKDNPKKRIVISTATINLQQQLMEKDIPLVQQMMDEDIKVVLAKGRGNYLCLNRFDEVLEEDSLFREEDDDLMLIKDWIKTSEDGSRSDLPLFVPDSLWSRINSDSDTCSGQRCRKRDNCFLLKARREAASAQLIITNHHLLFADVHMRKEGFGSEGTAILPAFHKLIVDEAHNIEQSATSYFTETLNRFYLQKFASMLYRKRKNRSFGILKQIERKFSCNITEAQRKLEELPQQLVDLEASLKAELAGQYTYRFRLQAKDTQAQNILMALSNFQSYLLMLIEQFSDLYSELDAEEEPILLEFRNIIRRFETSAKLLSDFSHYQEETEAVFWIEQRRTSKNQTFFNIIKTPLEISLILQDYVFSQYHSTVLTSATLSVRGKFDHWQHRVGLRNEDCLKASLASPFDYENRSKLFVPSNAPEPNNPEYADFLVAFLKKLLISTEGSALVLFTSYELLRKVYEQVAPQMRNESIPILRQGEDDRAKLLSQFKEQISSVLFATDSFWEGVDSPGDTLRVVVLTRLPFKVPTDPVIQARTEALEQKGRNAFFEYTIPEAALKLKQGFGRLMRRKEDHGVVIITDKRLVEKSYGKIFLDALPNPHAEIMESERLIESVENFLYR
jgi:ATP-dependent DNA helicase DinG